MRCSRLFPLLAALTLMLAACGSKGPGAGAGAGGPPGGMPPTVVETVQLSPVALPNSYETIGTLRAAESAVIRPEVGGKVARIHFAEGQPVKAGALLFSLDSELVQADLNEAQANLDNSRRAMARANELAGKQLVSRAELDAAKAALAVDQARVASAQARLSKTQIRAPFAGIIGLRSISEGDFVSVGQALVDLVQLDPMEVELQAPEVVLADLAVGQSVELMADAYPGQHFAARVAAIAPTVDVGNRSVMLRAHVANPDGRLKPGLSVRARLVFATNPTALMVPEQAIWPNGDQKMVYRVEDGTAKLVPVTLGVRQPGRVEVLSGLAAGDEIVVAGHLKIHDGAKVQAAKPAAPDAAAPDAN